MEQKTTARDQLLAILKFSRHPSRNVVRLLYEKHEEQNGEDGRRIARSSNGSDCLRMDGFALFYFAERTVREREARGTTSEEANQ
jgi:hypothetical protein